MTEPASSPPAIKPLVGANHASSFDGHGYDPMTETSASRHGTHLAISAMSASSLSASSLEMRVVRNRHWFLLRRLAPTN